MNLSPEWKLVLCCARAPLLGDEHEAPLRDLLGRRLDWQRAGVIACQNRVGPLVYSALRRLPMPPDATPALEVVKCAYVATAARNAVLFGALKMVLEALSAGRTPVIVLKGAALAETVYPERALRPMADIDLLIREEDLEKAECQLRDIGYEVAHDPQTKTELRTRHHHWVFRSARPVAGGIPIELHWSLDPRSSSFGRRPDGSRCAGIGSGRPPEVGRRRSHARARARANPRGKGRRSGGGGALAAVAASRPWAPSGCGPTSALAGDCGKAPSRLADGDRTPPSLSGASGGPFPLLRPLALGSGASSAPGLGRRRTRGAQIAARFLVLGGHAPERSSLALLLDCERRGVCSTTAGEESCRFRSIGSPLGWECGCALSRSVCAGKRCLSCSNGWHRPADDQYPLAPQNPAVSCKSYGGSAGWASSICRSSRSCASGNLSLSSTFWPEWDIRSRSISAFARTEGIWAVIVGSRFMAGPSEREIPRMTFGRSTATRRPRAAPPRRESVSRN